jgi:hypothetical protein
MYHTKIDILPLAVRALVAIANQCFLVYNAVERNILLDINHPFDPTTTTTTATATALV